MADAVPIISKLSILQRNVVDCTIDIGREVSDNNLKGSVEIWSVEDEEIVVIQHAFIEITGTASCQFTLDEKKWKSCLKFQPTEYKDCEDFYYNRHTICGGEHPYKLKSREQFAFMCHWPSRMPGTWQGEYGSIKYSAKVTIKLPTESKMVFCQDVGVSIKRDLLLEPHLSFEERKDVRRSFFRATSPLGHVDVSVWIPLSGIAAGQNLPVLCTVRNRSECHFAGLVFVLTRIDSYRSTKPSLAVKNVRTDMCRVARMVDIHKGGYCYYAVLKTRKGQLPTNQFYACKTCRNVYEVWVSLQGSFRRYTPLGYPNLDTPGLPIIIGTDPINDYDCDEVSVNVLTKLLESQPDAIEQLPGAELEKLMQAKSETACLTDSTAHGTLGD